MIKFELEFLEKIENILVQKNTAIGLFERLKEVFKKDLKANSFEMFFYDFREVPGEDIEFEYSIFFESPDLVFYEWNAIQPDHALRDGGQSQPGSFAACHNDCYHTRLCSCFMMMWVIIR